MLLQDHDEVLHDGAKVPSDGELFERYNKVFASLFPRLAPAEAVTKLAVCVLMEAATARHAEVAPHVLAGLEVQVLDCAYRNFDLLKT